MDIFETLNEIFKSIGINRPYAENAKQFEQLINYVIDGNFDECVGILKEIISLPVQTRIQFIERDFISFEKAKECFAYVSVPTNLPFYGSEELSRTTLTINITRPKGNEFIRYSSVYIYALVHELSHVLLKSLRNPNWNNEKYVDLVVMMLGFCDTLESGRVVEDFPGHIVRYGYLTNEEFNIASNYIFRWNNFFYSHYCKVFQFYREAKLNLIRLSFLHQEIQTVLQMLEEFSDIESNGIQRNIKKLKCENLLAERLIQKLKNHIESVSFSRNQTQAWYDKCTNILNSLKNDIIEAKRKNCFIQKKLKVLKKFVKNRVQRIVFLRNEQMKKIGEIDQKYCRINDSVIKLSNIIKLTPKEFLGKISDPSLKKLDVNNTDSLPMKLSSISLTIQNIKDSFFCSYYQNTVSMTEIMMVEKSLVMVESKLNDIFISIKEYFGENKQLALLIGKNLLTYESLSLIKLSLKDKLALFIRKHIY